VFLSAHSLIKRYGAAPGYEAVRGASLELRAGECVSIVGRSGSGKSTLMAMLGALTRPTSGKVLLDGVDVWTLGERQLARLRCRQIGFIFQFPSLLPSLTLVDNVAVPALLDRTVDAAAAYVRAHRLLARVGLGDRADDYPDNISGGEQRRVAVARALINAPRLLLADEPTSDLDEGSERDLIELLEELQRSESFGSILVTHSLDLARRAQRVYEMREGMLAPADMGEAASAATPRPRHFGQAKAAALDLNRTERPAERLPIRLGGSLWQAAQTFLLAGTVVLCGILLLDFGISRYQRSRVLARAAQRASLQHMALNSLRGDVRSIADLGDGRYELTTYLQNVAGGQPVYVMEPDLRAYVQVGMLWQEVPARPDDANPRAVVKIDGTQTYRYVFDGQVKQYAQLLPNYMHVRFSATMLVSPTSVPKDDVFERKDNYYVYLKPFDVADEVVLKRMRFSGRPPLWIPMPPH
jgi:ABC-type lipoprotein export system ATPase subunit